MNNTKAEILNAAMFVAMNEHYRYVTRAAIAKEAHCHESAVSYHFGTMVQLRRTIVGEAIRTKNWMILAQALVDDNPRVVSMKQEILAHI